MIKIRKFNEGKDFNGEDVFVVLITSNYGFVEDDSRCFKDMMHAADYYIKWINHTYDKNYEPFFENGTRLFLTVEENEDFDDCFNWFENVDEREKAGFDIEIRDMKITQNSDISKDE